MEPIVVSTYDLGHQPQLAAVIAGLYEQSNLDYKVIDLSVETDMNKLAPIESRAGSEIDTLICTVGMLTSAMLFRDVFRYLVNAEVHINRLFLYGLYASDLAREAEILGAGELIIRSAPTQTEIARDLDLEPIDARRYFPSRKRLGSLDRYKHVKVEGGKKVSGYVETTGGCRHRCKHCPLPIHFNGKISVNPLMDVLADVEVQVAAGATHVTVGDPDFFNAPVHAMKFARELHKRFSDTTFDCTIKIEHLIKHNRYLGELGQLGCTFITSAVESMSDEILDNLSKGHKRDEIYTAVSYVDNAGIDFHPSFVPFTPWTGKEDYEEILRFVYQMGMEGFVEPVQLAIKLLVPEASLLLSSKEFLPYKGSYSQETFSYLWSYREPAMAELELDVKARVQKGEDDNEPFDETFWDLWHITEVYLDREILLPRKLERKAMAVSSSETWFCCAEPTASQRISILDTPYVEGKRS